MTPPSANSRISFLFASFSSLFFARAAASGATFLTLAILGRALGRGQFGDLIILLTISKVAAELLSPALDVALVRFVGMANDRDRDAAPYVRAVFRAKLTLAVATLAVGLLLLTPVQRLVFSRDGMLIEKSAITLAFLGAAMMILATYVLASFQAHQRFTACAAFELASALARLAAVLALLYFQQNTITAVFFAYAAVPAAVGAIASFWLPSIPRVNIESRIWRDLGHYAKWVAVACLCTSLMQRFDVLIIAAFKLPTESISDYGAALQLSLLGDLISGTLFSVLLTQASRMASTRELIAFIHGFRIPLLIAVLSIVPLAAASGIIARLTFGPAYAQTGQLFAILLLGTVFAIGAAPAGAALYGYGQSRSIAAIEFMKLLGILIGGIIVVPKFGVTGMAWTVSLVKGGAGLLTYAMALRQFRATT